MRLYVSESGVGVSRRLVWLIACGLSLVLAVTVLTGPPVMAADAEPEGESQETEGEVLSRPDAISAAVTARVSGKPVEVVDATTETATTVANPDGTFTTEEAGAIQRVRQDDGSWADVDFTLVEGEDGSFRPKVAPTDVVVNGGNAKEAARVNFEDEGSLALSWPEDLPEPTVDGGVATYELSESTDLLVSVTQDGLATRIRLNEAPAEDDPVFTLGVRAEDVAVEQTDAGALEVTDGKETVGGTTTLLAWDAQKDEFGDPSNVVEVEADLSETSTSGDVTRHDLELRAPEGFLSDPETEYPVIIDPDMTAARQGDTTIRQGTSAVYGTSHFLLVGSQEVSSNKNPWLSLALFDDAAYSGKKILGAKLKLYQYGAATCSNRTMYVHRLTGHFAPSTTTYATRPSAISESGVSGVVTKNRASGCEGGRGTVEADLKFMVAKWANGTAENHGVQLNVPTSAAGDESYERRFCSMNPDSSLSVCNTSTQAPTLTVTYNSAPYRPYAPTASIAKTHNGVQYVGSTAPKWSVKTTDPEASKVRYHVEVRTSPTATSVAKACSTSSTNFYASGTPGSCTTSGLTNNTNYVVRARAEDHFGAMGAWGPWSSTFRTDSTTPSDPAIACSNYTNKEWYETRPAASSTCTISSTGAATAEWSLNGKPQPALNFSGGSASTGAIDIPTSGYTHIQVTGRSRAGRASTTSTFSVGTGPASIVEPVSEEKSSTTFPVQAAAPSGASSAKIQWRLAPTTEDDTTTGWTDASEVKTNSGSGWSGAVSDEGGMSTTGSLRWNPRAESALTGPSVVEVRVVFDYPGSVTKTSPLRRIQTVPHAFGGNFPTSDIGPGQVALYTGELQFSETDVDVPGYGESLTLGRSHLSMATDATGPAGLFGPGWTADLSGPESGVAGFDVVDNTAKDGSFILLDPEGESYGYRHTSGTRGAQKAGTYVGVGDTEAEEDTLSLATVSGETGISHRLTLTEWDGTKTIWARKTASGGTWVSERVIGVEDNSTTRFEHDADGYVTWILAPAPSGVTCTAATQQPGCRALNLIYTGTGTTKRLSEVRLRAWDPKPGADGKPSSSAGMATITVAKYSYDANNRLAATWDPRIADGSAALKTEYEYDVVDSKTKVTKVTEPGLKPWRYGFGSNGKLENVKRAHDAAVGSGDATWTVRYGLNLNASGDGLPNMSPAATSTWGQSSVDGPTTGAAVWEPNRVPASTPSADDYEYASLSYWDTQGRTTNTASFGAGAWQIDTTRYDGESNTIWELDALGRATALANGEDNAQKAGLADAYATFTVYNADATRVEEVWGPTSDVILDNGDAFTGRSVTETVYDDEASGSLMPGRPTTDVPDGGFGLAVQEKTYVTDKASPGADGSGPKDERVTHNRYDKIESSDGDGWELKTPTRTIAAVGTSVESTTITRFDTEGKTIQTRTPQGVATGEQTRWTNTVYYTADGSASRAECRNAPAWTGQVCWTGPAAQPSGGQPIPSTSASGFSLTLTPTRVEETSGGATRTTVTTFDAAERETKSQTTTSGMSATDRAVPATTTSYSATTGAVTQVSNGTQTATTSYDTWGRVTGTDDGIGGITATSYDTAGRVATNTDGTAGNGKTTFTYNGTDANGNKERRNLVNTATVSLLSGSISFAGAYDAGGNLVREDLPGGITKTTDYDVSGAESALAYVKGDEDLIGFSVDRDADGKIRHQSSSASEQVYTL